MRMEETVGTEMLVPLNPTTWCYIPEDVFLICCALRTLRRDTCYTEWHILGLHTGEMASRCGRGGHTKSEKSGQDHSGLYANSNLNGDVTSE